MKVFDLRFPLGFLFVTLGFLLVLAGVTAAPEAIHRSLGIDINSICGGVMIVFGLSCLLFARRQALRRNRPG